MISILYNTLMESAPYVVLGFLIAGIIHNWVPQRILHQHLGAQSSLSLFKAVGIGCVLPLCSCGTIPLGIGLYRSGAAIGTMLAFMTSTPILSPILIALSIRLLGATLTATLVAASVIGALVIGFVGNRLLRDLNRPFSSNEKEKVYSKVGREKSAGTTGKIGKTLHWSFFELGADVSVDILIGLGIAAVLLTLLPLEWISAWLGQQDMFTLLYVILLGIPVYACSIPSIAVVQGLLLLGATPGAAIAYMIAGPATNLGELNAIRKAMGLKSALFYAAALLIFALAAGAVTDQLIFPDYQYHAYRVQGELVVKQCCVPLIFGDRIGTFATSVTFPLWHWPFGILFFAIITYGLVTKMRHFLINPCKTCTWKEYGTDGVCGSKCHVRRKYEFLRRFK